VDPLATGRRALSPALDIASARGVTYEPPSTASRIDVASQPSKAHDVFVSYAREELEFVLQLRAGLGAAGLDVWVDLDGIYGGEEFWPQIRKAIDAATALVYVISPRSAASPYCRREVDHAIAGSKRIVPLCRQEVDAALLPPAVASRQWIFLRNDSEADAANEVLVGAIRADWEWERQHARLLVRAEEWKAADRDAALTLRGRELREADAWLARPRVDRAPAPLQLDFVRASHDARRRRALRLGGMAVLALATILVVGWLGLNFLISSLSLAALDDLTTKGNTQGALDSLGWAEALCARVPPLGDRCDDVASNYGNALLDVGRYDDAAVRLSRLIDATAASSDADVERRRAVAYRNRAYARIMAAEALEDATMRDRAYTLALQDTAAADPIEKRLFGSARVNESALTAARVHIGRGAYDEALKQLDLAGRFQGHEETVALLRALASQCLRSIESIGFLEQYTKLSRVRRGPQYGLDMDYFERVANRCAKH
jgi:hypothetical protein